MSDKKQANGKKLRAFKVETLTANELRQVSGGTLHETLALDSTGGTNSVCHEDGTTDSDH